MLAATAFAASAAAQTAAQLEYELQGVDVTERIGEKIPLDISFTDDNDRTVTLAQYFKPGRPVLISLNYADCPRLCSYQLNDLAKAMRDMEWVAGREFIALTISVNPNEGYKSAKQAKLRYLGVVGKQQADAGWHFLTTTSDADIHKLADALGFQYRFDAETGEYRHKAALFVVNGDGVISHYLRNMAYDPTDLQAQLKASSEGKMGQPSQDDSGFGLNCFAFEYTDNVSRAFNMMRVGGVGILVFLFSFVGYWWYRELRKPREEQVQAEAT
ncbi:MAG: SCO family protein [Planctomycetes bacterium]|nr:SCO family protein [Planctomycetota bacterium]